MRKVPYFKLTSDIIKFCENFSEDDTLWPHVEEKLSLLGDVIFRLNPMMLKGLCGEIYLKSAIEIYGEDGYNIKPQNVLYSGFKLGIYNVIVNRFGNFIIRDSRNYGKTYCDIDAVTNFGDLPVVFEVKLGNPKNVKTKKLNRNLKIFSYLFDSFGFIMMVPEKKLQHFYRKQSILDIECRSGLISSFYKGFEKDLQANVKEYRKRSFWKSKYPFYDEELI